MKGRPGSGLIVSDWRPLRVSRGYKENYDQIKWESTPAPEQIVLREGYKAIVDGSNNPFRLVKIRKEDVPGTKAKT